MKGIIYHLTLFLAIPGISYAQIVTDIAVPVDAATLYIFAVVD